MVQPINYLEAMPQVDLGQSLIEGLRIGTTISDIQQKQAARQQEMLAKQQAEQRLTVYRGELENAFTQGTPQAFSRLMTLFPEHQAAIKPQFEQLSKDRQQGEIAAALPVASALLSNNPKVAKDLIEARIKATPEGQDTSGLQALSSLVDADPQTARNYALMGLSQVMAPDKFAETFGKLAEAGRAEAMAPITMRKETALSAEAEEKAKQAAIKSRFAESEAVIDLEKKGWDIRKIQADMDIARQNARIAAANVQIGKTTNDLKRQELELKVEDMKQKRDESVRLKAADASTAASQADNLLNTTELALQKAIKGRDKSGKITGYTRTIEAATGPVSTMLPTIRQDVADFEELVNTLGSQITMSRIGEMKGALSDKDLETLRSSLQSLSLRQSPQQLVNNLLEVQRLTLKARKETIDKFGAPERLSQPDIPAARGATAPAAGGFTVTAPNGQTFTFPTKQAADQFRQAAGIR